MLALTLDAILAALTLRYILPNLDSTSFAISVALMAALVWVRYFREY